MPGIDWLTPAERRLVLLLFFLALVGRVSRSARELSPGIEAWLEASRDPAPPGGEGLPAPAPAPDSALARGDSAGLGGITGEPVPKAPSPGGSPLLVDPNRADLEGLMSLPGVGPVLAGRILADRESHGPYRRPEDLLRVPGIGPATLARIRDRLRIR